MQRSERLKEARAGLAASPGRERAQKAHAELGSLLASAVRMECRKFCAGRLWGC